MSWVRHAEEALANANASGALPAEDGASKARILRGENRVSWLDQGPALAAPLILALAWFGADLREVTAEQVLDPLALLLRLVAYGFGLRTAFLGVRFVRRLRLAWQSRRYALWLGDEGLLLRSPSHDIAVAREDVLGVVSEGAWQHRTSRQAVYIVTQPRSGRVFLELPPVFEPALAEVLGRWVGAPRENLAPLTPLNQLSSAVYDAAARGQLADGVLALSHGPAWLLRGPFATVACAAALLDGVVRAGPILWQRFDPVLALVLSLALLAAPLVWLWLRRRDVAPRAGLSLVMTPESLLIRNRKRLLELPWPDLKRATVESKRAWSLIAGAHRARELVLRQTNGSAIRYDEIYLGTPPEVVQVLCQAYRDRRIERANG